MQKFKRMQKFKVVFVSVLAGLGLTAGVSTRSSNSGRATTVSKLTDQQFAKCVNSDRTTSAAMEEIKAAHEMRKISTKVFSFTVDSAKDCPDLKKNLENLRQIIVALYPAAPFHPQSTVGSGASTSGGAGAAGNYPSSGSSITGSTSGYNPPPPFNPDAAFPPGDSFGFPGNGYPPPESQFPPPDEFDF